MDIWADDRFVSINGILYFYDTGGENWIAESTFTYGESSLFIKACIVIDGVADREWVVLFVMLG